MKGKNLSLFDLVYRELDSTFIGAERQRNVKAKRGERYDYASIRTDCENIIIKALNQHFYFTANVNDTVATEDLYGMFMDGTISLKQVKVETSWGKNAIKKAIISYLKEMDPNIDENEIFKRVRIKNRRKVIACGIKLKNSASTTPLTETIIKHSNTDFKSIAEEMGVGCDYAHVADIPAGCEDAEF